MKIFKSLWAGALRALRSWKVIIIIWFVTLLLVSLFVLPVKGILRTGMGSSTAAELLRTGINLDILSDLENYAVSIFSHFTSVYFLFMLAGVLMYSFFAGGLFKSVSDSAQILSVPCFFRAAGKYFWYFLGVWFFVMLMILVTGLLIVGLPAGLTSQAANPSPGVTQTVVAAAGLIFLALLLIFLLVADYARAWLIAAEKPALFRALGSGFRLTFSHFGSSFFMMLIIMVILVLFGWITASVIGAWKPETGGGVLVLFIVSQLLFFVKILLKTWRYGSVTALMEKNKPVTH